MFHKAVDYHKPDKPLIPNGLGVIYVLVSVGYLFLLYYLDDAKALPLAVCILFGGFMGLLDDWIDLRWRYKAFFPLVASIPLISLASKLELRTSIATIVFGDISFGAYYYFLLIPIIVTLTTNTINQLGGLNGLETLGPSTIMVGLMIVSGSYAILLYIPLAIWLVLTYFNFRGRIFVGNTGSFAMGITLASFAIITDIKTTLLFSILPYIINSILILSSIFLLKSRASLNAKGNKLSADHRKSLLTLIAYYKPMTEKQLVLLVTFLIALSTLAAVILNLLIM